MPARRSSGQLRQLSQAGCQHDRPGLKGARERWDGKGDIYAWIRNSQEYLKTGNEYANKLFEGGTKSVMTPMALSDEEIDAVLYYADNYAPPAPKGGGDVAQAPTGPTDAGSLWPWMLVLIPALRGGGLSSPG